ncbi:enoyl-CoA hydratase/carnithine racemase [Aliiruegeria haliotis]|uniref:Enoyl-CoA hydratase/carnithine racemase n=1 Tax=Aliiruegeria haliotis TaxID=1280846 RepID=A0A2T0RWG7_9RHOB|nr:enoyl-CoA hydratase/isomerase family protein [Aliiruegeria haliotis]PRY25529.1 enoyl-CoA hydratase/carnithine racemase [Aliiruegeria haliotis]
MTGIVLEVEGPVAILRLNRPEKLNALATEAIANLARCCAEIERMPGLRGVVLTGEGKAFCAGGDITSWGGLGATEFSRRWIRDGHDAFDALARLRLPVIAVLNGHALGGGLELAACADYRIAEEHVKLGQPETGLGMIPGWSGTQRAVRRFGQQVVRRMTIFGDVFPAARALDLGLVDQVVESGAGMKAALQLAERVVARGPRATELTKMLVNAAEGEERERVLDVLASAAASDTPEVAEGTAAFREKRPAVFPGDEG